MQVPQAIKPIRIQAKLFSFPRTAAHRLLSSFAHVIRSTSQSFGEEAIASYKYPGRARVDERAKKNYVLQLYVCGSRFQNYYLLLLLNNNIILLTVIIAI